VAQKAGANDMAIMGIELVAEDGKTRPG